MGLLDRTRKQTGPRTNAGDGDSQLPDSCADDELVREAVRSKGLLARPKKVVPLAKASAAPTESILEEELPEANQGKPSPLRNTVRSISRFVRFLRIICASASILLLVVIANQVATLFQTISGLWLPLAWLSYVLLGILGIFTLYAVYKVLRVLIHLRPVSKNKIDLLLIGPINAENKSELQKELRVWLENYQLDEKQIQIFEELGMDSDAIAGFKKHRLRLLETTDFASSEDFIRQFIHDIQEPLDHLVDHQRRQRSRAVLIKTAVSRFATIDALVVLYHSLQMVANICRVYGVRPSNWETFCILSHTIFNSYVAIRIEEFQEPLEELLDDGISEVVGKTFTSTYIAKATMGIASGVANAMMLNRIGKQLQGLVCVVNPSDVKKCLN